jgi:phenylacetate-CoA ligase
MSGGNTEKQIMVLQDFKSTVLCCTPSYSLYIAEVAAEMGVDLEALPLRVGVLGAEPWSGDMRDEIEHKLKVSARDIYGLSEIIGPGVSAECDAKNGLHIFEDYFIPEIIDPETMQVLPPGEKGELVITAVGKEALPMIRYRTKDITRLMYEPCSCGRTLVRMERVTGRSDDMLIIRGVNVFPSQIESVLLQIEGVEPQYQIVVCREGSLDQMDVQVEVTPSLFTDELSRMEHLRNTIRQKIKDIVGVTCEVTLVEPKKIERSMGKAKRVIDKRKA